MIVKGLWKVLFGDVKLNLLLEILLLQILRLKVWELRVCLLWLLWLRVRLLGMFCSYTAIGAFGVVVLGWEFGRGIMFYWDSPECR